MDKNELIAKALEERIAQLVTQYERAMAEFRADATIRIGVLQEEIKKLQTKLTDAIQKKDELERSIAEMRSDNQFD